MGVKSVGRSGRVFRADMPKSSISHSAASIAVSSSLMGTSYGRVTPDASAVKAARPSMRVHRVRFVPPKDLTVAALSRLAYERAGVPVGGSKGKTPDGPHAQVHTGGRTAGGGRPVGTGRNTWQTLRSGMGRAVCAGVVHSGFDVLVRRLFPPPAKPDLQDVFAELHGRAIEYYRGEVWPLRYAFGVLSRFVNGVDQPGDRIRTPQVVTTWLNDAGFICCSCAGRAKHVGRVRGYTRRTQRGSGGASRDGEGSAPAAAGAHAVTTAGDGARESPDANPAGEGACGVDPVAQPDCCDRRSGGEADAVRRRADVPDAGAAEAGGAAGEDAACEHSRTFRRAVSWLCRRLGVSTARFRQVVPAIYAHDSGAAVHSLVSGASASAAGEDWDAEGPMEVFRTGQSAVAVVISGLGLGKVIAPVRCTRNVTSCSFCDSAAGFTCVHALRSRGVRRGEPGNRRSAPGRKERVGEDGARSRLPISLYNCPASVVANSQVCNALRRGEDYVIKAPPGCPKCKLQPPEESIQSETGSILCTMGYCAMRLEWYVCTGKGCETRVFPGGRDKGVVIWSASTAATAVVMRDIAREMCTSGSTFGACYRHWNNKYVDLRDSGLYPGMANVKGRSRQTITCLFFHAVNLMTMEPPQWAFTCPACQDKDGRWRIITADGIWLGYLKRLATGQFKNATQECTSVLQTVYASSLHPSEWVRRFLRTALKQPTKAVVIKGEQLNSAKRALWLMCPAALPSMTESAVSEEKRLGMARLRALLSAVWDVDRAGMTLSPALIVHLKKRISAPGTTPPAELAGYIATLQEVTAWKIQVEQGGIPGEQQQDGGGQALAAGARAPGSAEDNAGNAAAAVAGEAGGAVGPAGAPGDAAGADPVGGQDHGDAAGNGGPLVAGTAPGGAGQGAPGEGGAGRDGGAAGARADRLRELGARVSIGLECLLKMLEGIIWTARRTSPVIRGVCAPT